jgi:hypothetical protein
VITIAARSNVRARPPAIRSLLANNEHLLPD